MSLFTDIEYVRRVGSQLPLFEEEGNNRWTLRCVFCGDSSRNKFKKRAALLSDGSRLYYHCVHCGKGTNVYGLLEHVDVSLRDEYVMDTLKDNGGFKPLETKDTFLSQVNSGFSLDDLFSVDAPALPESSPLDHFVPLTDLPDDHPAVQYVLKRLDARHDFMYTDNFKQWANEFCGKDFKIFGRDPRVVAPLYNREGKAIGAQGRSLDPSSGGLRYITSSFGHDDHIAYGLDGVDWGRDVWVLEGVYDARSVDNGIAVLNASLHTKAEALGLDKEKTVLMFDNEPGNPIVSRNVERAIDSGWRVAFYVGNQYKDANELYDNGVSYTDYTNVYSGLRAKVEFTRWKGMLR